MARPEDTRSPSPTGSSYSYSSRRSRRNDDRHDRGYREDGRSHHRRRSRSRSPDVRQSTQSTYAYDRSDNSSQPHRHHGRDRERDRDRDQRDSHRRERSLDRRYRDRRREEDDHYSHRRDRSRDRRRSRDRDNRRRSRDRTSRRDDSRDRGPRLREHSADSRKRRRDDSRDAPSRKEVRPVSRETSKPSTPVASTTPTTTAEDEQAAKLAKIEEWKRKRAAKEQANKKEQEVTGGVRGILDEIDRRAGVSPTVASPQPPATPETTTAATTSYTGKFDPKAIVKKAHGASAASKVLGADITAPANGTARPDVSTNSQRPASPASLPTLKSKGVLSRFGLAAKATNEQEVAKKGLAFDDDEQATKKLGKLPSLPAIGADEGQDVVGADNENDQDEDDNDIDMQDGDDEEAALAAARAAAEQRSQAERTEDKVVNEEPEPDTVMVEDDEEEDPLDAFMTGLAAKPAKQTNFRNKAATGTTSVQQQPEAMFGDDEVDITAVDEDNPDNILSMASATAKKKKKEIPTVNHEKMQYRSFRRSFYSEPIELSDLTEEEVGSLRMELDNIKVRGVEVPKPVRTWAQCGLGVQVLEVIQKLGYEAPTSIQSQAVPAIMSGRDVIGVAKTGSGKTIAFLLPMFRHIKDQPALESLDGPVGLILSPTRELATQIHKECKPFIKALGLRAVCAYGGAPIKDQIADFKRGAEIVVCTPGRMIDLLAANGGRVTNLRRVTYVVLDEADRMFDMGFEPQVMKILAKIRPDRQTVLFSATFPRQMEALARKTLDRPVEIVVGGRSVVAPEITQIVEVRAEDAKFLRLLELLGKLYEEEANEDDRALIFVDRHESADGLLRDLMKKGYPCMSIHGGKDQIDRDSTIQDFKAGVVPIMIATSVAARGLDVKQLKLVVNYDAPNHLEDYVHRAGRTGRAGNTGTAVTFLTPEQDRYSVDIAKALKQSGQPVPEEVQKLVDSFLDKVKAGKEKAGAGGFGGKGLERLDQERDAAKARERKSYKTGEEGEDQEEKEETKDAKVGDDIFSKAASSVGARDTSTPTTATNNNNNNNNKLPETIPGVPKGIDLDGKIIVHKTERPDPKTGGSGGSSQQSQMDRVAAAVAGINQKLSKAGVMRSGVPIDNKGPDAGAFHATLEINDFPQKARWAVTNRTNVAKILESTGTSITTKGSFYATGKEPQAGENPKLYILVEGDTEVVVQDAMRDLMRLLKEGTMSAAESSDRGAGRYSVV